MKEKDGGGGGGDDLSVHAHVKPTQNNLTFEPPPLTIRQPVDI